MRLVRARAQHLTDETAIAGTVREVVAAMGAIQAQAMPAAVLAIRPRSRGLTASDVGRALDQERSVVRTWAMRGTLHLVAAEDVAWMTSLLGPISAARGRSRRRQLGIDDALAERAVAAMRRLLAGGPMTRAELIQGMAASGIAFEGRSQGPIHLIALAAMQGLVVYGPDRKGKETFVLLQDWIGRARPVNPEWAARELARRYVTAHGPAEAVDFAAWSGLPIGMAREAAGAAAPQPSPIKGEGGSASVRLLPAFDEYLLGYASRAFAFSSELERRLQRGGGWIHPAVVVNGRGIAAWLMERRARRQEVAVEAFERIGPAIAAGIQAEVADLGRYLGVQIALQRVTTASDRRHHPESILTVDK